MPETQIFQFLLLYLGASGLANGAWAALCPSSWISDSGFVKPHSMDPAKVRVLGLASAIVSAVFLLAFWAAEGLE